MNNNQEEKNILPENFKRGSKSINLIPSLTRAETAVVATKSKLNISAAISLLIFVFFTLLIVGFNIFAKMNLNRTKNILFKAESDLRIKENIINSNDEIVRRVLLFQDVEKKTYSTKSIIVYLQNLSKGFGTLNSFELVGGTDFRLSGTSPNLTDVSKFWYVLGNDKYIKNVNLKNVTKGSNVVLFTFEGVLNITSLIEQNN